MAAMYLAVARPISGELDRLQGRMAEIDKSLRSVAGQRESAKSANDILGMLAEQGRAAARPPTLWRIFANSTISWPSRPARSSGRSWRSKACRCSRPACSMRPRNLEEAAATLPACRTSSGDCSSDSKPRPSAAGPRWPGAIGDRAVALDYQTGQAVCSLDQMDSLAPHGRRAEDHSTQAAFSTLEAAHRPEAASSRANRRHGRCPPAPGSLVELKDEPPPKRPDLSLATSVINQWRQIQDHLIAPGAATAMRNSRAKSSCAQPTTWCRAGATQGRPRSARRTGRDPRAVGCAGRGPGLAQDRADGLILLKDKVIAPNGQPGRSDRDARTDDRPARTVGEGRALVRRNATRGDRDHGLPADGGTGHVGTPAADRAGQFAAPEQRRSARRGPNDPRSAKEPITRRARHARLGRNSGRSLRRVANHEQPQLDTRAPRDSEARPATAAGRLFQWKVSGAACGQTGRHERQRKTLTTTLRLRPAAETRR